MKNVSQHINLMRNKFAKKALAILLTFSLAFSCFMPSVKAFADTKKSDNNQELIARKAESLTTENNSMLDQGIFPDIKSPFVNPIQIIINQLYAKVIDPSQKFLENELSEALNWILGKDPETPGTADAKLSEIQASIDDVNKNVKNFQQVTLDTLGKITEQRAKEEIITALSNATLLLDKSYQSIEICTIDDNIKSYSKAKEAGDKSEMIRSLKNIADVFAVKEMNCNESRLSKAYDDIHAKFLNIGGSTRLDNLYDKILNSNKNLDEVINTFNSLFYPCVKLMEKINDYQLISLVALREHNSICDPGKKLVTSRTEEEIAKRIVATRNRIPSILGNISNLETRIKNIPNLTLTIVHTDGKATTTRYHSLGQAWIDAQADDVAQAKITLYSDYVYNGQTINYYGEDIKHCNQNMKFDLPLSVQQYGSDKDGYFKAGNLNVKSGKHIELDLNSYTIANLENDLPTITVSKDATLHLMTSATDGQLIKKGQVGSVKYETGSAGSVQNVLFDEKYNFSSYHVSKKYSAQNTESDNTDIDNNLKNANCTFEYKTYNNVKGADRKSAAITNGGATKNFEVAGCDFINLQNKSDGRGAGIEINSVYNNIKTNDKGEIVSNCAAVEIKDCSFINCKAKRDAAISTTKHIDVKGCNFDNCKSSIDGGAITKYQIEGDSWHILMEEKTKFDKDASTISYCNFTNNSAGSCGGAINILGSANINDCTFNNNTSTQGGAINTVVRKNLRFTHPDRPDQYDYFGDFKVVNSKFNGNSTTHKDGVSNDGGAIYIEGSKLITNDCQFTNNSSNHDGGAVFQATFSGELALNPEITNTTFTNNKADNNAGAIQCRTNPKFDKVEVTNNYADNRGGGILVTNEGTQLSNVTIKNNKCKNGRGAGMIIQKNVFLHDNVVITDNYLTNGEASDLRPENLCDEHVSPQPGFCQGGSNIGLDLKDTSNIITDKKKEHFNKGWIERINKAKQYMHINDGRSINVHDQWHWFRWRYWLQAD